MEKAEEFIDFSTIHASLNIEASSFSIYLKELFSDLSEISETDGEKYISKINLKKYLNLPSFINEKVYNIFDRKNSGFVCFANFNKIMTKFYLGTFEETAHVIFDIYDFDNDGIIKKEDVRLLLSFLPLKDSETICKYRNQLESLEELSEILNTTFGKKKESFTFEEFLNTIEKVKSDIYIQMLCFLYSKKPFDENTISIIKHSYHKKKSEIRCKMSHGKDYHEIPKTTKIPSPSKLTRFVPTQHYLKKESQSFKVQDASAHSGKIFFL